MTDKTSRVAREFFAYFEPGEIVGEIYPTTFPKPYDETGVLVKEVLPPSQSHSREEPTNQSYESFRKETDEIIMKLQKQLDAANKTIEDLVGALEKLLTEGVFMDVVEGTKFIQEALQKVKAK